MQTIDTIREFKTKHFTVRVEALEEHDLDLSFDESGEVREKLETGEFIAFCAHAVVFYKGREVGEDYLGNCIYKSLDEFADHRVCGRQNRKWAKQGKEGRCGSYFSDMIREAIREARKTLRTKPYIRKAGAK